MLIIIILGVPLFGEIEPDWAGLSPSLWLIMISILIGIFIIIDIILYATPRFFINTTINDSDPLLVEFPEVEQRNGKQVYDFTYPASAKGGVFSKTYVKIGEEALVRIRNQMIKKEEIWKE
jgi:hypothetical protein